MLGNHEGGRYTLGNNMKKSKEIGYSKKIIFYTKKIPIPHFELIILFLSSHVALGLCFLFEVIVTTTVKISLTSQF